MLTATWLGALSERPALSLVQPGDCQRGHELQRGRASVIPSRMSSNGHRKTRLEKVKPHKQSTRKSQLTQLIHVFRRTEKRDVAPRDAIAPTGQSRVTQSIHLFHRRLHRTRGRKRTTFGGN